MAIESLFEQFTLLVHELNSCAGLNHGSVEGAVTDSGKVGVKVTLKLSNGTVYTETFTSPTDFMIGTLANSIVMATEANRSEGLAKLAVRNAFDTLTRKEAVAIAALSRDDPKRFGQFIYEVALSTKLGEK